MTYRMIMISIPMYIWGLRLCIYLWVRKYKINEDYRYKLLRESWEAYGSCAYFVISYFAVFFGQCTWHVITNSAVLYVNLYSVTDEVYPSDIVGLLVWSIGFYIEVLSDR